MGDLRFAWRLLARAPGFAAVAVITLALGIGVNVAIFSIVAPMLLEPLPYPEAQRIVNINQVSHGRISNQLDGQQGLYLLAHQRALAAVALEDDSGNSNLSGAGTPVRVNADKVTHGYFAVWGVAPSQGRDFNAGDDQPGAPRVAILSHGLWRSQFGGETGIVGQTFRMNGDVYTVIGVMPASYVSLTQNQLNPLPAQLWVDMQPTEASLAPLGPNLNVIGRLGPGVSLAQAQADLTALKLSFDQAHPQTGPPTGWGAQTLHDAIATGNQQPLWLLLGAVGLVLLIACANLANLLLARATGRAREIAIRAALGADRGRIVRQLLTESALLAGLGAVLGWLLAWWSIPLLVRLTPAQYALPLTGGLNAWALAFTVGIAVVAALLFGLAPALHSSRGSLQASLKDSVGTTGSVGTGRVRAALIVGEVALAFILLAGAGLLAASLAALQRVNPGFDLHNVLTAQTSLTGARAASDAATTRYTQAVIERLRRIPGVEAAASITGVPLTRAMNYPLLIGGKMAPYAFEWRAISPGFFSALRIALVRGRDFAPTDTAAAPAVAIVSRRMAEHFWPHGDALGQEVGIPDPSGKGAAQVQIAGIAADVHENGVDVPAPYTIYVPQAQASDAINALVNHWFAMGFVIRGRGAGLAGAVRQAFASVDADQPVYAVQSLAALKGASLDQYNFMSVLLAIFAGLALLLGGVGIYGVLAYAVAQQRREIGIRMAMGADRRRILRQVVGHGLKLTAFGLVLGVIGAIWLTRLLNGFLYGVAPGNPWVLAAVAVVLVLIAWLASLRPAWAATRVDPLQALRPD